jgi:hypothetical protein
MFYRFRKTELSELPLVESRANFIAWLMQLLREELRLHLKGYGITRRSVSPDYISVGESVLRLATSPDPVFNNYHTTNLMMKTVSVCGSSVDFKKMGHFLSLDDMCWSTSKFKSWKITRMQVNASSISALKGMRLHFLFVLLMYLLHSLKALSMEYICIKCVYYGMCVHEDSKLSSFKPNLIENWTP